MADLIAAEDLAGLPGAPFSAQQAKAAGDQVRRLCGWHIAPAVSETLTLDSDGSAVLMLPSLHVTNVTAVRDVTGDTPRPIERWSWSQAGMLERRGGRWPRGFRSVEVDLDHGYDECPPELLPVIGDFSRRRVAQESIGGRSVSFVATADDRFDSVLSAFRIGARP